MIIWKKVGSLEFYCLKVFNYTTLIFQRNIFSVYVIGAI